MTVSLLRISSLGPRTCRGCTEQPVSMNRMITIPEVNLNPGFLRWSGVPADLTSTGDLCSVSEDPMFAVISEDLNASQRAVQMY